jgi:hypothetical protein
MIPDSVAALGVDHAQDDTVAEPQKVDAFLAIILSRVEHLDREWITGGLRRLIERDAMPTPVDGGLGGIPFERGALSDIRVSSSLLIMGKGQQARIFVGGGFLGHRG